MQWHYTDAQIRTLYRDALDRAEEIEILSQLECKPKEKIIEKLEQMGEVIELRHVDRRTRKKKKPQQKKQPVHQEWKPEEIEAVRKLVERGYCMRYIRSAMHTSIDTLKRVMTQNGIAFPKKFRRNAWPEEKITKMRRMIEEEVPESKIVAILHTSPGTLKKYRQKLGI